MEIKHPLLLVRHGEAEHHIQGITGGWSDTRLTETGLRQVNLLAGRLHEELNHHPIHLGSSNLQRARQTAQVIASSLAVEVQIYESLTDLNNGVAAGKTHQQARQVALPLSEPVIDWQPYPQAETWRQFYARVSRFMETFCRWQQSPALLVTHAATLHVIVAWWLGLPVESRTHFDAAPASLTVLKINRWGERSLERLNDTAHLCTPGPYHPIVF
ncbi:MAG: histidine phosphatase family protein [Chloroflexota bacterium]